MYWSPSCERKNNKLNKSSCTASYGELVQLAGFVDEGLRLVWGRNDAQEQIDELASKFASVAQVDG